MISWCGFQAGEKYSRKIILDKLLEWMEPYINNPDDYFEHSAKINFQLSLCLYIFLLKLLNF